MNHSLITADGTTHLKIVVVSLIAAIAVVVVGLSSRMTESGSALRSAQSLHVKSGKPIVYTSIQTTIR